MLTTGVELFSIYKGRLSTIERELDDLSERYPQNLGRALWQFNRAQVQDMLNYVVEATNVSFARVDADVIQEQVGSKPSSDAIERQGDIYFHYKQRNHNLGVLTLSTSLQPLYNEIYDAILYKLINNFLRSIATLSFSFFAFHWLVNRHLLSLHGWLDTEGAPDAEKPRIEIDRRSFFYTQGDEIDRLADSLNEFRTKQRNNFLELKSLGERQAQQAAKHASNLDAISDTLYALDQYVAIYNANDHLILATPTEKIQDTELARILKQPHRSENSVWAFADDAGLSASAPMGRMGEQLDGKQQFVVELSSQEGDYWMVSGVVSEDGVLGMLGADVTQLKQAEQQLNLAHRIDTLNNLAGGVAHDFNNMLGVAVGHIELAGRNTSNEKVAHHLERAKQACQKGSSLAHNLLAFARKAPLEQQMLDLNRVIRSNLDWIARTLPSNLSVELDLKENLGSVFVDRSLFENALVNLLLNARDVMPQGGPIRIVTRKHEALESRILGTGDTLSPGSYIALSVQDAGPGVPLELRRRVFEPFFTTKAQRGGSGVGLSMVHGFVNQSNGGIDIEAAPGGGSAFILYLPRYEEEKQPSTSSPVEVESRSLGARILVVEDEEDLLSVLEEQLIHLQYKVSSARDAQAAKTILQSGRPIDLVLTDVIVPGALNGLQLARWIQEFHPDVGVVIMSGYADVDIWAEAAGYEDWPRLSKPVDMNHLANVLEKTLRRHR